MKYYPSYLIKRTLLPFLVMICLFTYYPMNSLSYFNVLLPKAHAKEYSKDSIFTGTPIRKDSLYQHTFTPNTSDYYCLYSNGTKEKIQIIIQACKTPSLSYQLYNSSGNLIKPNCYEYLLSGKRIQLTYTFFPNESYLFALDSCSLDKISYTISYHSLLSKKTTQKKKVSQKLSNKQKQIRKKTISKNNTTSKSKSTTSKNNTTSKSKSTTSKNKTTSKNTKSNSNNINNSIKVKKRIRNNKISFSKSFVQISVGEMTTLTVHSFPNKKNTIYQWGFSHPTKLQIISKHKNQIVIKGKEKSTVIVNCKLKGQNFLSASCIIKIT